MKDENIANYFVQYGCGFSVGKGWLNFDSSPTLRLSRVPGLSSMVKRISGIRFPEEVQYGDICKGLLAPCSSCAGIYASHVLEHLSLEDFRAALRNTFEMLKPGGIFRLIVPDLYVRARKYTDLVDKKSPKASIFLWRVHTLV